MIAGGGVLALIKFCMAMSPPNVKPVVPVSAQVAITIAAPGAAALAHSASRIASASLGETTPGLAQLFVPEEGGYTTVKEPDVYPDKPKVERKVSQSLVLNTSVSSMTTIVCPWPELLALKSGFRL